MFCILQKFSVNSMMPGKPQIKTNQTLRKNLLLNLFCNNQSLKQSKPSALRLPLHWYHPLRTKGAEEVLTLTRQCFSSPGCWHWWLLIIILISSWSDVSDSVKRSDGLWCFVWRCFVCIFVFLSIIFSLLQWLKPDFIIYLYFDFHTFVTLDFNQYV